MAVPKFYEFFRAFLVVLQDGELHKMSEVRNRIATDMNLSEEDLSEIVDYISDMLKNQKAANNLLADFLKEKENLVENPYLYPLSDNQVLQNDGYHRFLFYKNFIALYLIDDEEKIVSIMRIFYAKRDYANLI